MLQRLDVLEKFTADASDGFLGVVVDFLIDERHWTIRYLVIDTGKYVGGRRVLVSPIVFREVDWSTHCFHLNVTRDSVRLSPATDTQATITREQESDLSRYYGVAGYWGRLGVWGDGPRPGPLADAAWIKEPGDPGAVHLRSARSLRGYRVLSDSKSVGHVEDLFIDEDDWTIRYLSVTIGGLWLRRRVLIAPTWARETRWDSREIDVGLSRRGILDSPPWRSGSPIDRAFESRLHAYYGRGEYWAVGDRDHKRSLAGEARTKVRDETIG